MALTTEEAIKELSRYANQDLYTPQNREAHRMAIQALERSRWVPVTERLPDGECIVLGFQNEMLIGYIYEDPCSDTMYSAENNGVILHNVTHWMPKPPGKDVNT